MKPTESADMQVVLFRTGRDLYALPIALVREVRRLEPLTRLPESPAFIAGVLPIGGRVLAVVDLGKRLGLDASQATPQTRILIVPTAATWVGLWVDEVRGVMSFPTKDLQPPPAAAQQSTSRSYVSAVFKTDERLAMLLDAGALFSDLPAAPVQRPKSRILLVDDSATIVAIFKSLLGKAGYDVITASDGESALASARKDRPDLIILDGILPGVSGYDVCRRLREDVLMKSTKILMMTGGDESQESLHSKDVGADRFMAKNSDPADALDVIRGLLAA